MLSGFPDETPPKIGEAWPPAHGQAVEEHRGELGGQPSTELTADVIRVLSSLRQARPG